MAGIALIIIGIIALIIVAVVSMHFWFHVFFILPEAVTSASTPLNSVLYAAFAGVPTTNAAIL